MARHVRWILAILLLGIAPPVHAQISTGKVYGTVVDSSGGALPGALVQIASEFGGRSAVAGPAGGFRILNLDHGRHELTVSLSGFKTVKRALVVEAGSSATFHFELEIATLEEVVQVSGASPVVDTRKFGSQTTLSRAELDRVPQARDPWDLLKTVPGIVVSRVNIAGGENDQQPAFTTQGADPNDTTYTVDGLHLDPPQGGGSPTYWDYGAFDEIAITSGGNQLSVQTGGVGFHFVTKRGTNRWRGNARGFLTHDDLQWSNVAGSGLEKDPRLELPDGSFSDKADHIRQIHEYGFDIGGPLIRDELFVWGSYGRQDIRKVRKDQTTNKTLLDGFNAKLNWHPNNATQASVFFSNTRKSVTGRTSGPTGFTHEERALVDQGAFFTDFLPFNIHGLVKFEVNHVFSPDFMVNLKYANWDTGFALRSRDLATTSTLDFFNAEVRGGSWFDFQAAQPLKHVTDLTGSYFAEGWGGGHELKFGFGYRKFEVDTRTVYGGVEESLVAFDFGPGGATVRVHRDGVLSYGAELWHAYVGDTLTRGRLTVTAGVRFDHQRAGNKAATVPASPSFPELLPGFEFEGGGDGLEWTNLSPRAGLTYAMSDSRKTVARLSFASYAGKLSAFDTAFSNPLFPAYQAYLWNDLNGDGLPTAAEVDLASGLLYWAGHDPEDPTRVDSPNRIDPDYKSPSTYEVLLGVDHELLPDLAVSVGYTWRKVTNQRRWRPRLRADGGLYEIGDYIENAPVTENGLTANTFSPDPELLGAGGRLLMNRPDYGQTFHGFEVTATKRLSNRWMARASFALQNHRENLSGPGAIGSPTRTINSRETSSGPQVDGGEVGRSTSVIGKGERVLNSKWQFNGNALYLLPRGFEVGVSVYGRQGFAHAIVLNLPAGADGNTQALAVPELTSQRMPTFWNLDLRLAKIIELAGDARLTLAAELFNVANSNTVLNRNRFANTNAFDRVEEIPNPRVVRLAANLSF